jgi:hypothetical protein
MRSVTVKLMLLQGCAAIALLVAALLGTTSLQSNGLHVHKLAYDEIALTILGVCAASCIMAAMLLEGATTYWTRAETLGFAGSVAVGLLAASAFANTDATINGVSAQWISGPAIIWLLALMVQFAVHASGERRSNSHAPDGSATL